MVVITIVLFGVRFEDDGNLSSFFALVNNA